MESESEHLLNISNTEISNNSNTVTSNISNPEKSKNEKKKYLLLEPAVFFIFFAISLLGTVFQTHLIHQSCKIVFNFNATDCNKIGTEEIESDSTKLINLVVQPYVAKILMTRTILESLIPSIESLFIGPWSDKFGRKPVIITSTIGYFLSYSLIWIITLFSQDFKLNPWYYIIASLPISLLGGNCCLVSGIFCYIADCCKKKNLAFRMVLNEAVVFLGSICGNLLSSYFLFHSRPSYIFLTSSVLVFLAVMYVTFNVTDQFEVVIAKKKDMFFKLFNIDHMKKIIFTCFEKRRNNDRLIIWLTIFSSVISVFVMEGSGTVMYLFVIEKFSWTIKQFTMYNTFAIANLILGNIIGMYILEKLFKFSIPSLALLGLASAFLDSIVKATSVFSWQMYLAMIFGTLRGMALPMNRAIISSVVPQHDLGKIMSFTLSLESISALGSAPLYTFVYSATIAKYAGVFNFISAGFYLLCYIFLSVIYAIKKSENTSP